MTEQTKAKAVHELAPELMTLLARHRAGEPNALDLFARKVYPLVRGIVFRFVGPRRPDEHEDLVQSCLEQVCIALDNFRGDAALTSFVYGVCYRTMARVTRYERVRRWFRPQAEEICSPNQAAAPEEVIERQLLMRRAHAALNRLTLEERAVFVLHQGEGLNLEEIAAAFGCSTRTVIRRLQAARAKLLHLQHGEASS